MAFGEEEDASGFIEPDGALGTAVMEFRDGIAWGEQADLVTSTDDGVVLWFLVGDRTAATARFEPGV